MKAVATIFVERRYLRWNGNRRAWGPWRPQFEVRDIRQNSREWATPRSQLRRMLLDADEKYAAIWSQRIREGQRPIGASWRLRFKRRKP